MEISLCNTKNKKMCPLKHSSRAHSQATLAGQCPITVQMKKINEKTDLEKPAAVPSPLPEKNRGMAGQCIYHSWVVQAPKAVVREDKFVCYISLNDIPQSSAAAGGEGLLRDGSDFIIRRAFHCPSCAQLLALASPGPSDGREEPFFAAR